MVRITMLLVLLLSLLVGVVGHGIAYAADAEKGKWYELSMGRVYVPKHLKAIDGRIDLLVHFHGNPSYVIEEIDDSKLNVAVLAVSLNGLSSVYTKPFKEDRDLFDRMLLEALMCTHELDRFSDDLKLGRIGVSSFSAGFGAVREILKDERYFDQISVLLMADSLYAGYEKVEGKNVPYGEHMKNFRRFARAAGEGEKQMIITHSEVVPGSYAGTQETADDLIEAAGTKRVKEYAVLAEGFEQVSKAEKDGFVVIGCAGNDGDAHMLHLREINVFVERMGFESAK
ncbi:hypothetical protein KS4_33490 [Poriferisphaera corsica]|uniref:Alpha/beta hydrolase n=1 Tax=Poriferisphaera corsica TaxID=2528020 RepID=A0A517YYH5_9BACT|nr:hypothetical protein [Poriferisphaera corsica]QDU35268.1 hypothetical protein KS4_33490 [Poriferisphaera corsica]